jgi:hypothetical protein
MKIQIPDTGVGTLHLDAVAIDEVLFPGDLTAAALVVDNAKVTLVPEPVRVTGLVVDLKIAATLSWDTPVGRGSESVHFDFPTPALDFTLPAPPAPGTVLAVTQLRADNLDIEVADLSGIALGPIDATGASLKGVTAPSGDARLEGVSLAGATFAGLGLPAAEVLAATIASVVAKAEIPRLVVRGLELPQAAAGDLDLGGLSANPALRETAAHVSILGTKVSVSITPSVTITIQKIVLPQVSVGVTVDTITIERLRAALEARHITVDKINLAGLAVPSVKLE